MVTIQSDGKVIIGGSFTMYNGTPLNRIARLNADGTLDASFASGTGFNNLVGALRIQSDDKILVGGSFTTYNGTAVNRIARLNADGTLDTSFNVGTGASSSVDIIKIQPDGKIIIAGSFVTYNGATVYRIARLNADGTRDASFNAGGGPNSNVRNVAFQPDGKIIIAGQFTTYDGTTANRIARLNPDGTLDTTFTTGTGANQAIYDFAYDSGSGKILIGGEFTSYNGTVANRIARLNADGTLDSTFASGTGLNSWSYALIYQPDGKALVGGNFSTYNDTTVNRIARLNADGTLDTTFMIGTGPDIATRAVFLQPDGNILIGGGFSAYDGTPVSYIARVIGDSSAINTTHTITTTVQSNISLQCTQTGHTNDTTVEFGILTPGSPLTQSVTCTVATNSANGYNLQTKRDAATATMFKDAVSSIPDRAYWDATTPNATPWQIHDIGLAFTVYRSTANKDDAWWGTGTSSTDPNNAYAGFPQSAQAIMTFSQYSATPTTTDIGYKLDVPTTQAAGVYTGTVTYQATVNP